ncbi:ribonuclease HII [Enterococcus sp. PF1-24]|uniref:ribonuclease HII n=1 Tax=unclassified Enterococcus TaxID=2608891 RepID=UPI00247534AF|nr:MULTISPECIES: ribonuclease HII [unclassified Enterococcus]MDH6363164.1 ribonuclease HII [Enterococcus sp. PFB1-1]MDH6400258.1 ribonuclease HII [Enterococcus sp. PF1-24]
MKSESISEIKKQLQTINDAADERLALWQSDERKGVQQALQQWQNRLAKQAEIAAHYQEMLLFEKQNWQAGYQIIAGIDEVGRGPLAGPVVAAAVILPQNVDLVGVNDSKQLSLAKRESLLVEIEKQALGIGVGIISPEVIDDVNIYEATKLAMQQAIDNLPEIPDFLLIDAMKLANGIPQENLIKGDARSISIAAASIVAKVTRDHMMVEYDKQYPGYGFDRNAGYGTAEHLAGIQKLGITPIHRKTFAPIKNYL